VAASVALDPDQYVFRRDCTLEAMRTQGARNTLMDTHRIGSRKATLENSDGLVSLAPRNMTG
jgi:hypothetical protein